MSTIERQVPIQAELVCGLCKHENLESAKFCGGCGNTLFEPCSGCSKPVRLTQRFCNECGTDLAAALNRRIESTRTVVEKAVQAAKEYQFDNAMLMLQLVLKEKDYRFSESVKLAGQVIPKVELLRSQMIEKVTRVSINAAEASRNGNFEELIRLLSSVPYELLDDSSQKALNSARAYLGETGELTAELKKALIGRDWGLAGSLVNRLMELCPDEGNLGTIASQVTTKLKGIAEVQFMAGDYAKALDCLSSIPVASNDDSINSIREKVNTANWLIHQFQPEPFATPTLGRLGVLLSKHDPNNSFGKEKVAQLAAKLKEPLPAKRCPYPFWTGSRQSSLGGEALILGWPQSIDGINHEVFRKSPGRFSIALGLALQGLGECRVSEQLVPRKGFLKSLSGAKSLKRAGKKSTGVWGIDIGSSGLRAVFLEKIGTGVVVKNAYIADYPISSGVIRDKDGLLNALETIKKMVTDLSLSTENVWVNFPGRETLARFIQLPPVDDKKAKSLLDLEVGGQFPMAIDQLALIKWIATGVSEEIHGRPSALIAARRSAADQRIEFLKQAGLNIVGMQFDQLALVNLVSREFSEELKEGASVNCIPAISVVDAGASSTTLLVVDQYGFWFRSIEGGSLDATYALARATKTVASEAETLKREPYRLSLPQEQYSVVEEKQEMIAVRLKQLYKEVCDSRMYLKAMQTWVVGGGCYSHGWIRRCVCNRSSQ